jgi:hypothetical protein
MPRRLLLPDPCGPGLSFHTGTSRVFTSQGPAGFRPPAPLAFRALRSLLAFRPSARPVQRCARHPEVMPARESFAPTRSARTPLVTTPSRHRLENRCHFTGPRPGRSHADCHVDDAAARAFALASTHEKALARGPPYVLLAQAARRLVSTLPPFDGFGWDEPTSRDGTLERSTRADRPAPFGTVGRLGCSRSPAVQAEGRFTRCPAKGSEISRTRGAFHREPPATTSRAFARHRPAGGALSTGCHQPVDSARRPFHPHSTPGVDEPAAAKARSLLAGTDRSPVQARRGMGRTPSATPIHAW